MTFKYILPCNLTKPTRNHLPGLPIGSVIQSSAKNLLPPFFLFCRLKPHSLSKTQLEYHLPWTVLCSIHLMEMIIGFSLSYSLSQVYVYFKSFFHFALSIFLLFSTDVKYLRFGIMKFSHVYISHSVYYHVLCMCALDVITIFTALACNKTLSLTFLIHFMKNFKRSCPIHIMVLKIPYMLPSILHFHFNILQSSMKFIQVCYNSPHQGNQWPWLKNTVNCFQSFSFSFPVNDLMGFTWNPLS